MLWNNAQLASSNPNPPDLQPNTRRVTCKMPFLEKPKLCKNERNKSDIFLEQLVGDKVVCSCVTGDPACILEY